MSAVQDIMKRAKELVVQAGNGTLDQTGLNNIARRDQAARRGRRAQSMNGTYAGRYLFSGTATLTPPFPSPALTYAGDDNTMQRVIGQGEQVDLNLRGWEAFSVPADRPPGRTCCSCSTRSRPTCSRATARRSAAPTCRASTRCSTSSRRARAQVGARANRLETQQSRLKDLELNVEDLLSKTEDADMAKAMVDFSMQQSIYQSALQSGARVLQPSLLDFLR